jgi:hypothetical protein
MFFEITGFFVLKNVFLAVAEQIVIDLILRAAYVLRSVITLEIRSKLGILSYFKVSGVVINKYEF